ncbi:MAG TPA: NAD-dependent succinate-semialdehyde dehydrogenase [Candidatus Nanopelagicales bacterium]|nr:NAD-dependent succinate-semialdehyde dehydrogenase [Candidatus Nanopelagicales bacterium]
MNAFAVVNPSSGEVGASYPAATDEQLAEAVTKTAAAHAAWSARPVEERAAVVRRVAELHMERAQELAEIINREMGKPVADAVGEVEFSAAIYSYYADHAAELLADRPITLLDGEGSAFIRPSSVGVILGIMPWNYPYYQVARFAGPNLAAGNTVLLKHAPQCPESALAIAAIFDEAGAGDAYTNIFADVDQIEPIIADPRVRGVSLTGSERAGAAVAQIAGKHLKKVVLELGGSDPFIVMSTDDMDTLIGLAVAGRLENTGQACNAAKRFVVADGIYDEFSSRLATALAEGFSGAPLSSARAADVLDDQVKRAIANGAEFIGSGERDGNVFPPGVLTGLTPENPVYREELFGPVAQLYRVKDEAEAIEVANDTPYGLGSYVFTTDPEQALRIADALDTGMVFVNGVGAEGAELPFGGTKRSGFGRELGSLGIEEFLNKKLIRVVS